MVDLLTGTAVALTIINGLIGLWVVGYRVLGNRHLRQVAMARERLKSATLAWIDGDEEPAHPVTEAEYQAIADLLASYGRAVRGGARSRVAELSQEVGVTPRLLQQLRSHRPWRRARAAYGLGDLATREEATQPLIRSLSDRDHRVIDAAARSLGALGAVEAVEVIVRRLATGHLSRPVGAQALRFLGTSAAPALSDLLAADEEEVRAIAAELLGLVGTVGGSGRLIEVLSDSSPEVRVRATRALGRMGEASAAAALVATLDDEVPYVRAAAATAIARVGHSGAFEKLVSMSQSDSFVPAHAAAYAAAYLDPDAVVQRVASGQTGIHLEEAADLLEVIG